MNPMVNFCTMLGFMLGPGSISAAGCLHSSTTILELHWIFCTAFSLRGIFLRYFLTKFDTNGLIGDDHDKYHVFLNEFQSSNVLLSDS